MGSGVPHEVTEKTRAEVTALKSFGTINEDIASYLGIHIETLVKKYKSELTKAATKANAEVASSLYKNAVKNNDTTAQIFWLKTRARWRTEDNKSVLDSNSELQEQIKKLREELDAKNRKEY